MANNAEKYNEIYGAQGFGGNKSVIETCEYKIEVDALLDENRSLAFVQNFLGDRGIDLSKQSIMKYKKKREKQLMNQLEAMPEYQTKMQYMSQNLVDNIGKIQQVDIIASLGDVIEQSSELLRQAQDDDIRIKSAQDMRFVTQNMLDAIKIYGDTVLKAQKFSEINKNPDLLKPGNTTINVTIKDTLAEILRESVGSEQGFSLIDKLRSGLSGAPVIDVESEEV